MRFQARMLWSALVMGFCGTLVASPGPGEPPPAPPGETQATIARYVKEMKNPDPLVRQQVIQALGAMGPSARSAMPILREALLDSVDEVKSAAAAALQQIDPNNIIPGADLGTGTKGSDVELTRIRLELGKAQQEIVSLRKVGADQEAKIAALQKQVKESQDKATAAQSARDGLQVRIQHLQEALEEKTRELARLQSGTATVRSKPVVNSPSENVGGNVVDCDLQSGLVVVDLGSDAGLLKGNTLEVFRLEPRPLYLGTLHIVDVQAHQAVGRPVSPLKVNAIQKGDRVASKIQGPS
ncbi:MAG: HEAT repeat domain-containing protein [Planctomycetes bacterium]|nr:HEAT repeat domain-containing protein [Planctomycetota bacterium]